MINRNNELEVKINIGPPASGKSTWSKQFILNNPNWVKVSRDDFRYMMTVEYRNDSNIEMIITEVHNQFILFVFV